MRWILRPLALAATALLAGEAAAETVAAIKSRALEATVELDDALEAHPGLFANLAAEGKRRIETVRKEAERARRETPDFFRDGRKWSYELSYARVSVAGRFVSVRRVDDSYSGGAHGDLELETILWDRLARKRIGVRPLFKETADGGPTMTALARRARVAVAREKIERGVFAGETARTAEQVAEDEELTRAIEPRLLGIGPIALAPSREPGKSAGLVFHYGRYRVGAHVEGGYAEFVHWSEFRELLSPEGLATFGGDRPEDD